MEIELHLVTPHIYLAIVLSYTLVLILSTTYFDFVAWSTCTAMYVSIYLFMKIMKAGLQHTNITQVYFDGKKYAENE